MILDQLLNGLIMGCMYALVALGYTLVFGVLSKLNFAHAEIFMFGGFAGLSWLALGAPLWLAFLGAFLVGGVLGVLVEWISFRKFTGPDSQVTAALSSMALGILLVDLCQKTWGSDGVQFPISLAWRIAAFTVGGISIGWLKLVILAVTLTLMALLQCLVSLTRLGRQIRAVADSPVNAALMGIDVKRTNQTTFFIASALAASAGMLLAMRTGYVSSDIGLTFGLKALAIMGLGGMGDLRGAVVGGILVGLLEALAFHVGYARLADIAVWILMIVVLLVRPAGLFGSGHGREVRA